MSYEIEINDLPVEVLIIMKVLKRWILSIYIPDSFFYFRFYKQFLSIYELKIPKMLHSLAKNG